MKPYRIIDKENNDKKLIVLDHFINNENSHCFVVDLETKQFQQISLREVHTNYLFDKMIVTEEFICQQN